MPIQIRLESGQVLLQLRFIQTRVHVHGRPVAQHNFVKQFSRPSAPVRKRPGCTFFRKVRSKWNENLSMQCKKRIWQIPH